MDSLVSINEAIVSCTQCPRLITHCKAIAAKKVRRYMDWEYWGKPVPGFGDPHADLLIVGLAPGAHGANRTGRMFTGDPSGDWLYGAMYDTGFANQANSQSRDDGLELLGAYITAAGRCAPPDNKPTSEELANCSTYLQADLAQFDGAKVILCLGGIAFREICRHKGLRGVKFAHGLRQELPGGQVLLASYHPSQQNTNTGRLTRDMWLGIFNEARAIIDRD
jgi:uracil-DNA glycosylase family 4